jgi:hypothetical protein
MMKHHMMDIEKKILDLKLAHIDVQHDLYLDALVIRHTATKTAKKISRYEIERLRDPYPIILEIIGEVMAVPLDVLHEIIKQSQLSQAASTQPMPTWDMLNGPKGHGPIGAVGAVYEAHIDIDNYNMKQKLFSDGERLQIMEVKKTIRTHMNTHMPMRNFDMSHVIVAGGCFASMLNGEVVKDFDVFLLESDTNRAALASIETIENGLNPNGIKVSGSEYMNNDKIEKVVTFGSNAIQYISTKYKNRLELIEHFDFKHCCVSYDYKIDRLFITRETFDLIKSKTLKQNTDKTPVYWRYEKFWQRGWKSEIAIATD